MGKENQDKSMKTGSSLSRRKFLKTTGAAAALTAASPLLLSKRTFAAADRLIKIGFVSPKSGPLAAFAEADDFVLGEIRNLLANGLTINGTTHPVRIIEKDSQSDPARAGQVAAELIKSDKVDILATANTPETVSPVSDQAEINGVPCVTTDAPWNAVYFGRGGTLTKGFDWTYHFFWGDQDIKDVYVDIWSSVPTNKKIGALWENDADGQDWSNRNSGFPPLLQERGFTLIDPGLLDPRTGDFSAQIALFKRERVDIITGVLVPPAFATFWSQAAQQGLNAKIITMAKAILFPAAVNALGDRSAGLSCELWWSPNHPFKSSLTGQSAAAYCAAFETALKKQWTPPLGFKHALMEVVIDSLKRSRDINSPSAIRDAIRSTNLNTIVGRVQWTGSPVKNVCRTPLVGGQWVRGKKYKYEIVVVNNGRAKMIPLQAPLKLMA